MEATFGILVGFGVLLFLLLAGFSLLYYIIHHCDKKDKQ